MSSFPTSLDSFTNPVSTDDTNTVDHASQHSNANAAIGALEAKVGADSSAVTTSHDYKLSGVTGSDKAVSKTGTETLTNKTLTAPVIATIVNSGTLTLPTSTDTLVGKATTDTLSAKTLTAPKFASGGFIADANGNELIIFTTTASALNEITMANGGTGVNPSLIPSGETNVGWDIRMKGTGVLRLPRPFGIQVVDAIDNTTTGDQKAFFRIPPELNGMNLTRVAATVFTAGTTNTIDIQIRNKTDSVDMLSTKMTIDTAETDTSTAATPAVIDTTKDDVVTGDVIAIDVDAVHSTPAKGLYVEMLFALP